jgi:hypothetical protein
MQDHKYSLNDIEMMIPWEREIYVTLLIQDMKEQEEQRQKG